MGGNSPMRRAQGFPDLPILLITGYAGNAINGEGRLESGMELLVKPFLDDLAARVQTMLELARSVLTS